MITKLVVVDSLLSTETVLPYTENSAQESGACQGIRGCERSERGRCNVL